MPRILFFGVQENLSEVCQHTLTGWGKSVDCNYGRSRKEKKCVESQKRLHFSRNIVESRSSGLRAKSSKGNVCAVCFSVHNYRTSVSLDGVLE